MLLGPNHSQHILSFASNMYHQNITGRTIFPMFPAIPAITIILTRESMEPPLIDDSCSRKECSICLDDFCDGFEISGMPGSHLYHKDCVEKWSETSHIFRVIFFM